MTAPGQDEALYRRLQDDLIDGFDEELELEVDDRLLDAEPRAGKDDLKAARRRSSVYSASWWRCRTG